MIAFLGTGHLGSNFVRALIRNNTTVNVWNRSFSKAEALVQYGAQAFSDVAGAVAGVNRVHLALKDDATVDEVLLVARQAMAPGTVIIDHTTTSKQGAIDRTHIWKERGFDYLHAPVFMSPENALECSGSMLVSGSQELIQKWEPELRKMTGKIVNYGSEVGKAAAMKLVRNHFIIGMNAALFEALELGAAIGIEANEVSDLFSGWNPGAVLPSRINKIISGNFEHVAWELQMARKDAGLMLNEATLNHVKLPILEYAAAVMDKHIANGDSKSDWTVIGRNFTIPK